LGVFHAIYESINHTFDAFLLQTSSTRSSCFLLILQLGLTKNGNVGVIVKRMRFSFKWCIIHTQKSEM